MNKCHVLTHLSTPDFYDIVLEIIISVIIILSSDYDTSKGSQLFLWTEKTRDILVPYILSFLIPLHALSFPPHFSFMRSECQLVIPLLCGTPPGVQQIV